MTKVLGPVVADPRYCRFRELKIKVGLRLVIGRGKVVVATPVSNCYVRHSYRCCLGNVRPTCHLGVPPCHWHPFSISAEYKKSEPTKTLVKPQSCVNPPKKAS